MSCGVGYRCGSDPTLLWLWFRPASTALIRPLAWEPPYAAGAAQEMAKKTKKKNLVQEMVQKPRLTWSTYSPAKNPNSEIPVSSYYGENVRVCGHIYTTEPASINDVLIRSGIKNNPSLLSTLSAPTHQNTVQPL